jgi:tryptophan halogenase
MSQALAAYSKALSGAHLDAQAYVEVLRGLALKRGVLHAQGLFRDAVLDESRGAISAIALADGRTFEADLFIDATGPEALLIGDVMGAPFEDWSRWLPCDRLLAASADRLSSIPAFAQVSAFHAGWTGIFPLRDRTALVAAYRADEVSDAEMLEIMGVLSGLSCRGEAVADSFRPGARSTPWVGNCVAIGEAAVALDPLDALQLHPIHLGVSQLIELFPVRRTAMDEAGEYNRAMASAAARMRDFQIAHFKLNGRFDEPLWDRAREMQAPDALAHKLDLFQARGRVAMYDDETFEEANWTSLFVGAGLIPSSCSPLVDLCPEGERMAHVQQMLRFIKAEVERMRPLDSYLESL